MFTKYEIGYTRNNFEIIPSGLSVSFFVLSSGAIKVWIEFHAKVSWICNVTRLKECAECIGKKTIRQY